MSTPLLHVKPSRPALYAPLLVLALVACQQASPAPTPTPVRPQLLALPALEGRVMPPEGQAALSSEVLELRFRLSPDAGSSGEVLELGRTTLARDGAFRFVLPGPDTLPCLSSRVQPSCLIPLNFGLFNVPGQRLEATLYRDGVAWASVVPQDSASKQRTLDFLFVERDLKLQTEQSAPQDGSGPLKIEAELKAGWNQVQTERSSDGQRRVQTSEAFSALEWSLRPLAQVTPSETTRR